MLTFPITIFMKSLIRTGLLLCTALFFLSGNLNAQSNPAPSEPKPKSLPMDVFPKQGRAGVPVSKHDVSKSCIDASKSTFTATLKAASDVDLVSFVVYATDCGGMDLKITGPDLKESARYAVSKGKNQIPLDDLDLRLTEGVTYTLTCTGVAGYGNCSSTAVPRFENTGKCGNVSSENHPNLVLNQKSTPHIFELKFQHQ